MYSVFYLPLITLLLSGKAISNFQLVGIENKLKLQMFEMFEIFVAGMLSSLLSKDFSPALH
jgi:hypothetical protein